MLKGMGGENTDGMRTDDRKGDNDRQETGTGKIGGRRTGMQATASRRHADIQTGGI